MGLVGRELPISAAPTMLIRAINGDLGGVIRATNPTQPGCAAK